ncbi:MAG: phosphoribosylanthranilate isomerase [Deltaproteobacteria bacterium]|nr:phosphoribosylanthranilate isomerase [Deltaproteobacteria bacterium]MBW2011072.1 phosphoribosylanthranilate isomerase [Deltaproteobacteria bacterium]MBW2099681.1 phosphoribosylanthranilate isomerase [Deltaproteobacteria bacterium]
MIAGVIHVAGIIDQAEADMLVRCQVEHLGFPFELAKHKEDLTQEKAAKIIRSLKPGVTALVITYLSEAKEIIALCRKLGVSYVQLHGDISAEELAGLNTLWPALRIIKSLVVRSDNLAELERQIETTAPYVDGYITDTFDPGTGASGATGKTHDWTVSRRLVKLSPHPVILAGGLIPGNVREAIRQVRPSGVDVHTGIEGPDGRKSKSLTLDFITEAKAGFAKLR